VERRACPAITIASALVPLVCIAAAALSMGWLARACSVLEYFSILFFNFLVKKFYFQSTLGKI
jgi:hypothetical protein